MGATIKIIPAIFAAIFLPQILQARPTENEKMNVPLTEEEKFVIEQKGTEKPFSGRFCDFSESGVYVCRKCGRALYDSRDKFNSGCGWPAFDDEISGAIRRVADADAIRTEIQCSNCGAHLGHVFSGEMLTPKNVRHCVNSVSMAFVPAKFVGRAYVAGGCFWGVEYLLSKTKSVLAAVSGYAGGSVAKPSYRQVCSGGTGHLETVEIIFDNREISYSDILKKFFEIHDFTQKNGQGPDIGSQYLSAVFYTSAAEEKEALALVEKLAKKGYDVATKILPFKNFFPAEDYHQRYYQKNGKIPYCHFKRDVF